MKSCGAVLLREWNALIEIVNASLPSIEEAWSVEGEARTGNDCDFRLNDSGCESVNVVINFLGGYTIQMF